MTNLLIDKGLEGSKDLFGELIRNETHADTGADRGRDDSVAAATMRRDDVVDAESGLTPASHEEICGLRASDQLLDAEITLVSLGVKLLWVDLLVQLFFLL